MMEPKFIELHDRETGDLFSINIQHIVSCGKEGVILTGIPTDIALATVESYAEIKQLIHDSGILIHRADPRLDTTTPLTMEDLKDMIGEPVWNSNTGEWTLVRNYIEALEPDGIDVTFLLDVADNSAGITAGDLIKFPLYRMKRE